MKIAVIGLEEIGRRHRMNLRNLGAHVVTVDHNPMTHPDLSDLDDLPNDLDGVVIATPPATHLALAEEFLLVRRLPVFIEKPLGLPEEREEWRAMLRGASGPVAVGYNWRYEATVQQLMGKDYQQLLCWYGQEPADRYSTWVWDPAKGGGVLLHYSHALDLIARLSDSTRPVRIHTDWLSPGERHAHISFSFADRRATCWLTLSGDVPISILVMEGPDRLWHLWHRESVRDFNAMYRAEMKDFLECISTTRSPICSADPDGLRILDWIAAIRTSWFLQEAVSVCPG